MYLHKSITQFSMAYKPVVDKPSTAEKGTIAKAMVDEETAHNKLSDNMISIAPYTKAWILSAINIVIL